MRSSKSLAAVSPANVPTIADVEDSSSFVSTSTFNAFVALLNAISKP